MLKLALRTAAPFALALAVTGCNETGEGTAQAGTANETADTSSAVAGDTKWVRTLTKTDAGGYLMGNPDAEVKLLEFGSLTCSHCATFHEQAMTELKGDYIASGQVSYELRPFVLNMPDFIATTLAKCTTPEAFYALSDAFFENQASWLGEFQQISPADQQRLQGMAPEDALVEFGRLGGVDKFVQARGLPASKYASCMADEDLRNEIEEIRRAGIEDYKVGGTPTFYIGDEQIEGNTWAGVKAALDEAL
ncbi:MAG: thioredoxin domain-containing protein [Pacificimonas sp.]